MVIPMMIVTGLALLALAPLVAQKRARYWAQIAQIRAVASSGRPDFAGSPSASRDRVPFDVYLGTGHSWIRQGSAGPMQVGADRLALSVLGRPSSVYLVPEGTQVKEGEPVAWLNRDDRSIPVAAPVAGQVTAGNPRIEVDPDAVHDDPFGQGWLVELTPAAPAEIDDLRPPEMVPNWQRFEVARMRDVLLSQHNTEVGATMHDGGPLVSGLSEVLDDDQWNGLVTAFFTAR